jgi:hypothetical protein
VTVSVGDALALCDWLNVTVVLGVDEREAVVVGDGEGVSLAVCVGDGVSGGVCEAVIDALTVVDAVVETVLVALALAHLDRLGVGEPDSVELCEVVELGVLADLLGLGGLVAGLAPRADGVAGRAARRPRSDG